MHYKPGETSPKTCEAKMCDCNGNVVNTVSVNKGQTLPPTEQSDCYYDIT